MPAALEVMTVGEFEPQVWVPSTHPAARRGTISLKELAALQVIHGPRRAHPGTYDAWVRAMQAVDPRFSFTDPPFRHSLAMTLALAAERRPAPSAAADALRHRRQADRADAPAGRRPRLPDYRMIRALRSPMATTSTR